MRYINILFFSVLYILIYRHDNYVILPVAQVIQTQDATNKVFINAALLFN